LANANEAPEPDAAGNTCFAYSARSPLLLTARRPGAGTPLELTEEKRTLDIGAPSLLEWHELGRPFARLWAAPPRFTLLIDGIGWFEIDRTGPAIVLPAEIRREARLRVCLRPCVSWIAVICRCTPRPSTSAAAPSCSRHRAGHEVTLFASGGSHTNAHLISRWPSPDPRELGITWYDGFHALASYTQVDGFDIVHDHAGVVGPICGAMLGGTPPAVGDARGLARSAPQQIDHA
jgi:hypothetical protein